MSPSARPEGAAALPRVGYLGPEGTFTEEALLASARERAVAPVPLASIYDTVAALRRGEVEWAIVPIENSLDGSVAVTLDLLADEAGDVKIVGEALLAVHHSLIAPGELPLEEIDTVLTHPQVPGQCAIFLRAELAACPCAAGELDRGGGAQRGAGRAARPRGDRHRARRGDLRSHRAARADRGPR